MNKLLFVLFIGLFWLPKHLIASEQDSLMCALYNIDDSFLVDIVDTHISEVHQKLWSSYFYFWKGINSDDGNAIETSCDLLKQTSSEINDSDSLYIFMCVMKVRIAAMQHKYIPILTHHENLKTFLKNTGNTTEGKELILGIYDYFSSHARAESVWGKLLLSGWPEGNGMKGIEQLKQLTKSQSVFISTESRYFLGRIFLEYEKDTDEAYKQFMILVKRYPNNSIFRLFYNRCLPNNWKVTHESTQT